MAAPSSEADLTAAYLANAADLLNYFGRRVDDPADAADLLNETFLVATRRGALPAPPEEARMWLFGVARHVLSNSRRSRRRQSELAAKLRQTIDTSGVSGSVPSDLQLDVQRALAKLPPNQAELVRLVLWEDFTVPQAATILRIRESTARGRYQRAISRLKTVLAPIADHREKPVAY
ncbi:RNA polymerase sigma-70 factor (ECF subfamily) [Microbacterium sp. AK009]|uniref:RNA polymerase sigma factor n=1 Tax=Microbacterium sp. AK009 TaxID=2723068 RepID=UPI0015CB8E45|nr:RNA polymerase sigma factor [Microbacterium sp. AK009]NYF16517.1 RNA polymerase sigma-70 factor (ECF subfamily) [Microbacterium sp. AK009]